MFTCILGERSCYRGVKPYLPVCWVGGHIIEVSDRVYL